MKPSLLLLALAACAGAADDHCCIDGLCSDLENTTPFVGPCTSAGDDPFFATRTTFAYHSTGALELITQRQTRHEDDGLGPTDTRHVRYYRDAAGALEKVVESSLHDTGEWIVGPDTVERKSPPQVPSRYDRALFAFLPMVGNDQIAPRAELGLVFDGSYAATWSRDGARYTRTWSTGLTDTFDVDAGGHLVAATVQGLTTTYRWDGDHLLARQTPTRTTTYVYDAGGNLVEERGEQARIVYDYSCW